MTRNSGTNRNYTLGLLAAVGFTVLLIRGIGDIGPEAQRAVCNWEWVFSQPLVMCRSGAKPVTATPPTVAESPESR